MNDALPAVAVVVVTHNSAATLLSCLRAACDAQEVSEIVVVDNASTDAWQSALPQDTRLRTIRNQANVGFAKACNQGAAATQSAWLLFLNPDCLLPRDALRSLVAAAARNAKVGVVGAQLLNRDGSEQSASSRKAPTPTRLLGGWRSMEPCVPPKSVDGLHHVEAVSGALMLLPRHVFERLRGFDEGYRLHCEDLDLCRRVHRAGYAVAIVPEVRVLHFKGTSSHARPFWVEWQKHRGMWRYFTKFDRASTPAWLTAVLLMGLCARFPLAAGRAWWRARQFRSQQITSAP